MSAKCLSKSSLICENSVSRMSSLKYKSTKSIAAWWARALDLWFPSAEKNTS